MVEYSKKESKIQRPLHLLTIWPAFVRHEKVQRICRNIEESRNENAK